MDKTRKCETKIKKKEKKEGGKKKKKKEEEEKEKMMAIDRRRKRLMSSSCFSCRCSSSPSSSQLFTFFIVSLASISFFSLYFLFFSLFSPLHNVSTNSFNTPTRTWHYTKGSNVLNSLPSLLFPQIIFSSFSISFLSVSCLYRQAKPWWVSIGVHRPHHSYRNPIGFYGPDMLVEERTREDARKYPQTKCASLVFGRMGEK
jgi:hypothetical protein